jgi:hypothetical protein
MFCYLTTVQNKLTHVEGLLLGQLTVGQLAEAFPAFKKLEVHYHIHKSPSPVPIL